LQSQGNPSNVASDAFINHFQSRFEIFCSSSAVYSKNKNSQSNTLAYES